MPGEDLHSSVIIDGKQTATNIIDAVTSSYSKLAIQADKTSASHSGAIAAMSGLEESAKRSGAASAAAAGHHATLEGGLRKVGSASKDVAGSIGNAALEIGKLGALAAGAGVLGLAGAIGGAVSTAASFEKQMSAVGAVAGATDAEFQQLRETALRIGKDTSFSASQAAGALEELVKAGVSVTDIMNGAADATVALAAAGGTDIATAAEIASAAMNNFGKSGSDMAAVANTIAGAVNASAIGMDDFKFSMASVGAVANTIGFTFEDTAVAIAAMGAAGIKGSDAGTSLKTMMLNLIPDTNKARDLMRELGLVTGDTSQAMAILVDNIDDSAEGRKALAAATKDGVLNEGELFKIVKKLAPEALQGAKSFNEFALKTGELHNEFFDLNGNVKSMPEVFGILRKATADLTKEQQISALQTIFGTDAIRASAIAAKLGSGGFEEMADKMAKQGDAAEIARKRLDNLAGDLEQLKGSAETAAIQLGSALTPGIRKMVEGATAELNKAMPAIEKIGGLVSEGIASGFDPTKLAAAFDEMAGGPSLAGGAILFLANEVFPRVQQAGGELIGWITGSLLPALGDAKDDFLASGAPEFAAALADQAVPAVKSLGETLGPVLAFIGDHKDAVLGLAAGIAALQVGFVVAGAIGALSAAMTGLSIAFGAASATGGILAGVIAILGGPVTLTIIAVAAAVALLTAAWVGNWGDIQGKTAAVVDFLSGVPDQIGGFIGAVQATVEGIPQFFEDAWNGAVAAVGGAFSALGTNVNDSLTALSTALSDGLNNAWTAATGIVTGAVNGISAFVLGAWESVFDKGTRDSMATLLATMGELWGAVSTLVSTTVTGIVSAVTGAWTTQTTATSAQLSSMSATVSAKWAEISGFVSSNLAAIVGYVNDRWTEAKTAVETKLAEIAKAVGDKWTEISGFVSEHLGAILKAIGDELGKAKGVVDTKLTEAKDAIGGQLEAWKTEAGKIGGGLVDAIKGAINAKAKELVDSATGVVQGALDAIRRMLPGGGSGGGAGDFQRGPRSDQAAAAARAAGIDPEIFTRQMSKESMGFNEDVISGRIKSPAGAVGIAQFMPGTAAGLGINPLDPIAALDAAAKLMRKYLTDYAGDWAKALAAYNAGPGNVANGQAFQFRETQTYIADILRGQGGPGGLGSIGTSQMQWGTAGGALTWEQAKAVCGPYAAALFVQATGGMMPDAGTATELARAVGWTPSRGMAGIGSELELMKRMGVDAVREDPTVSNIDRALASGSPVALSTGGERGHYFVATGGTAHGGLDVGATGTVMSAYGGKAIMTLAEIRKLTEEGHGSITGIIRLAGDAKAAATDTAAAVSAIQPAAEAIVDPMQWITQRTADFAAVMERTPQATDTFAEGLASMAKAMPELQGRVAAGTISLGELENTLVTLASKSGVAVAPLEMLKKGAYTSIEALRAMASAIAAQDPAFAVYAENLKDAGEDTGTYVLALLDAIAKYKEAKEQAAAAQTAVAQPATPGAPGDKPLADPAEAPKAINLALAETLKLQGEIIPNYQAIADIVATLPGIVQDVAAKTGEGAKAASDLAGEVDKVGKGWDEARAKLHDYLEELSKVPEQSEEPLASFGSGSRYVPATGLYQLHRGESVATAEETRRGGVVAPISQHTEFHFHNVDPRDQAGYANGARYWYFEWEAEQQRRQQTGY